MFIDCLECQDIYDNEGNKINFIAFITNKMHYIIFVAGSKCWVLNIPYLDIYLDAQVKKFDSECV